MARPSGGAESDVAGQGTVAHRGLWVEAGLLLRQVHDSCVHRRSEARVRRPARTRRRAADLSGGPWVLGDQVRPRRRLERHPRPEPAGVRGGRMTFAAGTLVRARGREWVVLPDSTDDLLMVRPLGGTDEEVTGILSALEEIQQAQFDLPKPSLVR